MQRCLNSLALILVLFSSLTFANFSPTQPRFLPVDQAFPFDFYQEGDQLFLQWNVHADYYLYQHQFQVTVGSDSLDSVHLPQGTPYHDEFFGDVIIYNKPLSIQVDLPHDIASDSLRIQYQGCAKAGFCYPPEMKDIPIDIADIKQGHSSDTTVSTTSTTAQSENVQVNGTNTFTDKIANHWWTPFIFLLLGVGLAFTPCVLPMYPILTSIVLGGDKQLSLKQTFLLSFSYVQGMVLTYTALGLVVASAGVQFQILMQHPYVLWGVVGLFMLLSLSMFGVYNLQLPSSIQVKLTQLSNNQQGGHFFSVFIMGAISGLVASPCTTAPLSGALLYVAQTGDLLTGGVTLYALAMGMGIPLILVAMFGNNVLPRAGLWMERVKNFFGFVLLAAAVLLMERLISEFATYVLWFLLGNAFAIWLYRLRKVITLSRVKLLLLALLSTSVVIVSSLPLLESLKQETSVEHVDFIQITSYEELQEQLIIAKEQNQAVMLDFYADWCVACKEFEKYTFPEPQVKQQLDTMRLLQIDVTRTSSKNTDIMQKMQILGLPTIDFWDLDGNYLPQTRVTGFMPADTFHQHLAESIKNR